jgi:hypothetical protein
MSFNTEVIKSIHSKQHVVIYQIALGKLNSFWINYAPGVYKVNFNNTYPELTTFTTVPTVTEYPIIASVIADKIILQKYSSIINVVSGPSSFYFEVATKTLFIHLPNGDAPDIYQRIMVGVQYAWRWGGQAGEYGGVLYQDRLKSISPMSVDRDPLFWGIQSRNEFTVEIENSDGALDRLTRDNDIFHNPSSLLLGFDGDDISDFYPVSKSIIGKITTNKNIVTIENKEYRTALTRSIPTNVYTTADYPNLNPDNVNKPKARVFGVCKKVPIVVTDEEQTVSTVAGTTTIYHFKICDSVYSTGLKSIDAIYVVKPAGETNITAKAVSVSLPAGTFQLKHTTKTDTQANPSPYKKGQAIYVDVTGETQTKGGDIIKKLNKDYYNIDDNSDNYGAWAETPSLGLVLAEQKGLDEVIGDICESCQTDFQTDGEEKYNLIGYDVQRSPVATFRKDQQIETGSIEDDPTEIITSILVGYSKNWTDDKYQYYIDDLNEQSITDIWNIYKQLKFDTLIANVTDAGLYSGKIMARSASLKTIIHVDIPGWMAMVRTVGEWIIIELNRPYKQMYNHCLVEIYGIQKDFTGNQVGLDCRLISVIADIPYAQGNVYANAPAPVAFTYKYPETWYTATISGAFMEE